MKILVDTSIWSLALRKKTLINKESLLVIEFRELINELRVAVIGSIRQELLSGISDKNKFVRLRGKLTAFEDIQLNQADYEKAAEISNECRRNGIQGSHIDFLICAVAVNRNISIFTADNDFKSYKKVISIKLHAVREEISNNGTDA
ncbi:MAG: PIN domain-containing protein [Spirochaetia bacterium]|jgi:predicted nucleic acid-binding protein|nr:PIN domain-containing protein [Spirochaetia bacterium]